MKLRKFSFSEKISGWNVKDVQFDTLTLLVGASGVGKTKILEAIDLLRDMANGESFNGIKWVAEFAYLNDMYIWEGETELRDDFFDKRQMPVIADWIASVNRDEFTFLHESLHKNGTAIAERKKQEITFNGQPTVKLSKTKSLLYTLKEEETIKEFVSMLSKMNSSVTRSFGVISSLQRDIKEPGSFEEIILSDVSLSNKLYYIHEYFPEKFSEIKNDFIDVFNFVADLKYALPASLLNAKDNPTPEMRALQLQEIASNRWIPVWDFSSGMRKAISIIAATHLCPEHSLVLLDEFENSFGVDCIEEVTKIILNDTHNNQFIMSSHHPYIINNIPLVSWRIVTRNGPDVSVDKAERFISTKSKHEAFIQLVNSPIYTHGIKE